LPCPGDPTFVARGRAGGGGRWGPGLPIDDADDAGPSPACLTTRLASHKQIAADLLPEAGESWAVEAEQGL
jgi:hypothetical protein